MANFRERFSPMPAAFCRGREEPGLDDMRLRLGVGLPYRLPIGPIRLEYRIQSDRHPGEESRVFRISASAFSFLIDQLE